VPAAVAEVANKAAKKAGPGPSLATRPDLTWDPEDISPFEAASDLGMAGSDARPQTDSIPSLTIVLYFGTAASDDRRQKRESSRRQLVFDLEKTALDDRHQKRESWRLHLRLSTVNATSDVLRRVASRDPDAQYNRAVRLNADGINLRS